MSFNSNGNLPWNFGRAEKKPTAYELAFTWKPILAKWQSYASGDNRFYPMQIDWCAVLGATQRPLPRDGRIIALSLIFLALYFIQ